MSMVLSLKSQGFSNEIKNNYFLEALCVSGALGTSKLIATYVKKRLSGH